MQSSNQKRGNADNHSPSAQTNNSQVDNEESVPLEVAFDLLEESLEERSGADRRLQNSSIADGKERRSDTPRRDGDKKKADIDSTVANTEI